MPDITQSAEDAIPELLRCRAAIEERDPRHAVLLRNAANEMDRRGKEIERLQGKYAELSRSHDAIEALMRENASWQQERVTKAMDFKDAIREAFEEYEDSCDQDRDSIFVGAVREILDNGK